MPWPSAPLLEPVQASVDRDSAVLILPVVEGARDYRAFRLPAGARVSDDGHGRENVAGTDIYCAGFAQHNDKATAALELLRRVQISDLQGPSQVVVEAIDTACPFPGALGSIHSDVNVTIDEVPTSDQITFSTFTADEIRARFGSLIVNGHRPGATLAAPAAAVAPRVLARTTLNITPLDRSAPRLATWFDDFGGSEIPTRVGPVDDGSRAHAPGTLSENAKWSFVSYNAEQAQFFIDRGQLHMTLVDWAQDVFATMAAYPRRAAQLSDTRYLHIGFDVDSNATARRYWLISLCGAEAPGQTIDANGRLMGRMVNTPFFYQDDAKDLSVEGWNCLQFFPRDGSPFPLGPTDRRSESDIRVMVNLANRPVRDNVVNVSPDQYQGDGSEKPGWFRTQDGNGNLLAPILDDQLMVSPRTHYDAYVRRDRLILYVNGEQRLCNDFPQQKLTMAEAAIGFGQVIYHSAAERLEFSRSYNDRTGQRYYLTNTPYVDERSWDNLGYEEGVSGPMGFDPSRCHIHP